MAEAVIDGRTLPGLSTDDLPGRDAAGDGRQARLRSDHGHAAAGSAARHRAVPADGRDFDGARPASGGRAAVYDVGRHRRQVSGSAGRSHLWFRAAAIAAGHGAHGDVPRARRARAGAGAGLGRARTVRRGGAILQLRRIRREPCGASPTFYCA